MPAWSDEVGALLLVLATEKDVALDQLQLQKLVYVAHGWRLALTGEPLTGDRPEALSYGPEYRRVADWLAPWGVAPIRRPPDLPDWSILDREEVDHVGRVFDTHRGLSAAQLSAITRGKGAPWAVVVTKGIGTEIGHGQVRRQFEALLHSAGELGRLGAECGTCSE